MTIDEAQQVASLLDGWEVDRIPRGSGFVLAAPTILQCSSDATKRRFLPPIASGEERCAGCSLSPERVPISHHWQRRRYATATNG